MFFVVSEWTVAVGQINTIVGNFDFNAEKIVEYTKEAHARGTDVICFPELSVCGYPPLDLLDRPEFVERNRKTVDEIAESVPDDIGVIVWYVERSRKEIGKNTYNAAALLREGEVRSRYYKTLLPTYAVFNEAGYFEPGEGPEPIDLDLSSVMTICEDVWNDPEYS